MTALTDINAYKAAHSSLDTFEAGDILDVDQNGAVTNADLQGLLNYLKAGNGSVAAVPEPASIVLFAMAGVACLAACRSRSRR